PARRERKQQEVSRSTSAFTPPICMHTFEKTTALFAAIRCFPDGSKTKVPTLCRRTNLSIWYLDPKDDLRCPSLFSVDPSLPPKISKGVNATEFNHAELIIELSMHKVLQISHTHLLTQVGLGDLLHLD
ncbi:unnamed protein product, partial [Ectocarpus sp. 12 AP-2014]